MKLAMGCVLGAKGFDSFHLSQYTCRSYGAQVDIGNILLQTCRSYGAAEFESVDSTPKVAEWESAYSLSIKDLGAP